MTNQDDTPPSGGLLGGLPKKPETPKGLLDGLPKKAEDDSPTTPGGLIQPPPGKPE
jgi:hypothetical protein